MNRQTNSKSSKIKLNGKDRNIRWQSKTCTKKNPDDCRGLITNQKLNQPNLNHYENGLSIYRAKIQMLKKKLI